MGFKDFKKALYESNLNLKKPPKPPVEMDEEIEMIYQDDAPWVDHLLRVQENFVILGANSGQPIMLMPSGISIGIGLKTPKLNKIAKGFNIIYPQSPFEHVTFILVEYKEGENSVLTLSDKSIVAAIEKKCTRDDSLTLSEDETEKLRLLIKGYNYILQF